MSQSFDNSEEALQAAKNSVDGFIEFDGQNCADLDLLCLGWDGESRRCDCGNRRVYWEEARTADGKVYYFPSAY